MVSIHAGTGSQIWIIGHGVTVSESFVLEEGVVLVPETPSAFDGSFPSRAGRQFQEDAAMLAMEQIATFSLLIESDGGGQAIVTKAWNALWLFHLLSIACRRPVMSLYSLAEGSGRATLANRNLLISPHISGPSAIEDLMWAKAHRQNFEKLTSDSKFSQAVRCLGNAHYLPDLEQRIMLFWSGIEGLIQVDGEIRRRIALTCAMIIGGSEDDKLKYYNDVKKQYDIRSRVVHGS